MTKQRGKRQQRVDPHLSRGQKASKEVADPEGFKNPATSGDMSCVTQRF